MLLDDVLAQNEPLIKENVLFRDEAFRGLVKLWIESKPTLCEQREDENLESNLWSIPVLLDKQLNVSKWNMSCTVERSFISLAWFGFAIVWHALCLQAWLGFRFDRAYVLMYRLEAQHRRAALKIAQDAKGDSRCGSKLSFLMANEKDSPPVSGNGMMWPQWGRRRSDGSVGGSGKSWTDSAWGDEVVCLKREEEREIDSKERDGAKLRHMLESNFSETSFTK